MRRAIQMAVGLLLFLMTPAFQHRVVAIQTVLESERSSLAGTVCDEENRPIAGASVYLQVESNGSFYLRKNPENKIVTTDSKGAYQFTGVADGNYIVWAEGEGLVSTQSILNGEKVSIPSADRVDLTLKKGCGYSVKVVDAATKKPLNNAEITFAYSDAVRRYRTNESGVVLIEGLPANDWYFVVKAKGYAGENRKTFRQEPGSTTNLSFELEDEAITFGSLYDQDGKEIKGAKIYFSMFDELVAPSLSVVETNEHGEFKATGLPAHKKLKIQLGKAGYKFQDFFVTLESSGEPEEIFLEGEKLPYGGDVIVTVVDENNEPIEGIELINRGNGTGVTRNAVTDENGKARLENLLSYQGCHVVARGKGRVPRTVSVKPGSQADPALLTIQMNPGKSIVGRVVGPEGETVERAMVLVYSGVDFVTLNDLKWKRAYTNSEGIFRLEGLESPTELRIMPRYGGKYVELKNYSVDFEKEEQLVQLAYGASIRIRAVDQESGERVPDYLVKLDLVDSIHRRPGDIVSSVEVSLQNPGVRIHGSVKAFEFHGQEDGAIFKVLIEAEGYQTRVINRYECRVQPDLTDIKLKRK